MKKLIVVAFVLCFALGAFADDTMNSGADQGQGTQTTQTHHKKHEKKMKKTHHKKHQQTAPADNGASGGNAGGAQ